MSGKDQKYMMVLKVNLNSEDITLVLVGVVCCATSQLSLFFQSDR